MSDEAEALRRAIWALRELQTLPGCRPSMGGYCSDCLRRARAVLGDERRSATRLCDWGTERVAEVEAAVTVAGQRP